MVVHTLSAIASMHLLRAPVPLPQHLVQQCYQWPYARAADEAMCESDGHAPPEPGLERPQAQGGSVEPEARRERLVSRAGVGRKSFGGDEKRETGSSHGRR